MSEAELVRMLLQHLERGLADQAFPELAVEFDALHGRPDVVASTTGLSWPEGVATALSYASSASIVGLLHRRAPRSFAYLRTRLDLADSTLKERLSLLLKLGIINRVSSRSYVLGSAPWQNPGEIWAFEAKLFNWQRALYQALRYKAFADRVVVVMPLKSMALLRRNRAAFEQHSIGVMCVDTDSGQLSTVIEPTKLPLSCRTSKIYAHAKLSRDRAAKTET